MKLVRLFVALLLLAGVAIIANLSTIPTNSSAATHFDTLIVLGYPTNKDGTLSPDERERVLEAVREYKAGVASSLITTGGAAHNRFVEAHVMANFAISQGVPSSAVIEERLAQNTIQNVFYSAEIMRSHQWRTAEVISSQPHLWRTAMILQVFSKSHPRLAFEWRTHPARWPSEYGIHHHAAADALESTRCLYIRLFGFPRSRFLP